MSLWASPSPRAADPKTHPYTGLGFQGTERLAEAVPELKAQGQAAR